MGTPGYLAPEVARRDADARVDVFSLGVVFFELITGTRPFSDPTGPFLRPPDLREHLPQTPIPASLDRVVRSTLAGDPELRPPTMARLREELEDALLDLDDDHAAELARASEGTGELSSSRARWSRSTTLAAGFMVGVLVATLVALAVP